MVRLILWRDVDPRTFQVLVNERAKHRGSLRHGHESLALQICWTDGFEGCKSVVARQNHHQRLLHENTISQLWHTTLPPKKRRVDFSFRQALRKQRRVLARYHHVDVRQLVSQDPQSLGHPLQFVPSQKSHREAWLAGMSDAASRFACRGDLR